MLHASNLSFAYNAGSADEVVALRAINLQVAPGEMLAIIGHNGSGKSTLAKLLCAMLLPTSGSVTVDGLALHEDSLWEVRRRVGMVFQRPDDQLVANTVIDDVSFGPENLGLPRGEIETRVRAVLAALGLSEIANAQISELSGGERQRVAIAGVLAMQPSYLILDEPTTMIAPRLARQVLALAHELRRQSGVAVLHITHFMHEVVGFDRVIVMDGGQVLLHGPPREVFAQAEQLRAVGLNVPLVTELGHRLFTHGVNLPQPILTTGELVEALAAMADGGRRTADGGRRTAEQQTDDGRRTDDGRAVGEAELINDSGQPNAHGLSSTVYRQQPISSQQPADGIPNSQLATLHSQLAPPPLIETRDLHFSYMAGTPLEQVALRGVSCAVYPGETLALLGSTQAGKSTLVEFFNALRIATPGHVFFEGNDTAAAATDLDHVRRSVGIVFQQPETQLFEDTVGKDVSFAPRLKRLPPAESRAIVERVLTDVGLDYETYRLRYVYALSGGQKRRVALAGALAAEPRVLILDEPVAGLDPRGRAELAALIADLTGRLKLTVVLVGNAIDELAELADRAIVLHDGQVVMEGALRALLRRADELHALGLELSEPAEIALALRPLFPDLPTDVLRLEELEQALTQKINEPQNR